MDNTNQNLTDIGVNAVLSNQDQVFLGHDGNIGQSPVQLNSVVNTTNQSQNNIPTDQNVLNQTTLPINRVNVSNQSYAANMSGQNSIANSNKISSDNTSLPGNTINPIPIENLNFSINSENYQTNQPQYEMSQPITGRKENAGDNVMNTISYHVPPTEVQDKKNNIYNQNSHNHTFNGLMKLFLLVTVPLAAVILTVTVLVGQIKEKQYQNQKEVLVSVPMKNVNWQDIGNVFEPVITLPVKTQSNYENWEFLIDSGAVISSLPNEWAEKTGQDLAFLKRSTFRGFGGKTSLAYQGEMELSLGDDLINIPVVFTESSGTKSLLGRKGFFENYSIYFNHLDKRIEIRK